MLNFSILVIYLYLYILSHGFLTMAQSNKKINFNKLFNTYYQQFVFFAQGYLKNEPKAQDFVSESFIIYWEHLKVLPTDTNAPAYILTIVKNKCLNYLQHEKVKMRAIEELTEHAQWLLDTHINTLEACDPDKIFSQEILQIIETTIGKLPKRTAEIFLMSRFDHMSHREIAQKLKLSTKSIEYHISKVLCELRVDLKDFLTVMLLLFCFI